jgi:membrane-bound lytic murein transglycosylase A
MFDVPIKFYYGLKHLDCQPLLLLFWIPMKIRMISGLIFLMFYSKCFSLQNQNNLRIIKPQQWSGWQKINHKKSLKAFQKSCEILPKRGFLAPQSQIFSYDRQRMKKLCHQALNTPNHQARIFFEKNFLAYQQKTSQKTLFTGYYAPTFKGSLVKTRKFQYPIYATPKNLIHLHAKQYGKIIHGKFVAYDERKAIAKGSIQKSAKVLAWVEKPMDVLELEIQGSGAIQTPQRMIYLQYESQNGHPYYPIGQFLIADGKIPKEKMSMLAIRQFFDKHPSQVDHYFNQNPSYVFFKEIKKPRFLGYNDIPLSSHYSLAVDQQKLPIGLPILVETTLPNQHAWSRLMVAQDVGGAIKGFYHFDIYFGRQIKAQDFARKMQSYGNYWVLLPS